MNFTDDLDARICEYCGLIVDDNEHECPSCHKKTKPCYVCPICGQSYTKGNITWHYLRHYEGMNI
jgi:predicted amidophosphoribosyltransferase